MESGWIGGGVVEQEQAGGDGRHLLLSGISQQGGVDRPWRAPGHTGKSRA